MKRIIAIVICLAIGIALCIASDKTFDKSDRFYYEATAVAHSEMITAIDDYLDGTVNTETRLSVTEYNVISFPSVDADEIGEVDGRLYYRYLGEPDSGFFDEGCAYVYTVDEHKAYLTAMSTEYYFDEMLYESHSGYFWLAFRLIPVAITSLLVGGYMLFDLIFPDE